MKQKIKISFLLFNLIISSILLFNNAFFISVFLSQATLTLTVLNFSYYTLTFISFLVIHYIAYLIFARNQKIFKSVLFILILSSFIIGYYSLKYQLNIDAAFIINVTNELDNTKEVISLKDVLIITAFISSLLYLFLKVDIKKQKVKIKGNSWILISIIIISFISISSFKYSYIKLFNTYEGINRTIKKEITRKISYYKYVNITQNIIKYYKYTPSSAEIVSSIKQGDVILTKKDNNITTIFLMSDSVRAKSMSLMGYELETNPNLQKLCDNKQIYLFKQDVCASSTFISLNCMLSLKKAEEFRDLTPYSYAKEKITKYFNYLEVGTYYLANNHVYAIYSGYKYVPINSTIPTLDNDVLPYLYKSINSNSQFITVNLRGAHVPYDVMLEERFKKFTPKSNDEKDVNYSNYHNKILQTDYIWSNIIDFLSKQDKPIFLILTADHGQSLGETYNGVTYTVHGAKIDVAPPEQKEVPLIVYVNDAYKRLYPNYVKNIEKNMAKHKDGLVQSDIISHSLLHCSGIEGNVVDKSLSLCSNLMQ